MNQPWVYMCSPSWSSLPPPSPSHPSGSSQCTSPEHPVSCIEPGLEIYFTHARRSNQSILKEISPGVHWKDWCWSCNSNPLANWCKEMTHLKRLWCWERLRAGGEGDDRGWDDWMASPTQWTWVLVDSGSWWCTGRPGMLQFMGSQRIDAFELWCWRRLLRVPWTARRSNHSILKEISPEYSLEGLMLK